MWLVCLACNYIYDSYCFFFLLQYNYQKLDILLCLRAWIKMWVFVTDFGAFISGGRYVKFLNASYHKIPRLLYWLCVFTWGRVYFYIYMLLILKLARLLWCVGDMVLLDEQRCCARWTALFLVFDSLIYLIQTLFFSLATLRSLQKIKENWICNYDFCEIAILQNERRYRCPN